MNRQRAAAALQELAAAILEDVAPDPASGDLLTIKEAGLELGGAAHPLHPSTVLRMCERGDLKSQGAGKRRRIFKASVEAASRGRASLVQPGDGDPDGAYFRALDKQ